PAAPPGGQLAHSKVHSARSTLGDRVAAAAALILPLWQLMHKRLLLSRVIQDDDTHVKLRMVGAQRTSQAHWWAAIGDADYPYVVFDFTAAYTKDGPGEPFKGYKGYLQAGALAQHEGLYGPDKVKHVCCWAHARLKFVAAADGGNKRANVALGWI